MAKPPRADPNSTSDDEPSDDGAPSFAWEFVSDDHRGNSPVATPRPSSPVPIADPRAAGSRAGSDSGQARQDGQQQESGKRPQPSNSKRPGNRSAATRGTIGSARANYIRDQLDRALDLWWAAGEIPPLALLRDGLLMLEAGGAASESQRTLLLRAALAYDRGIQTALHHQVDVERVAMVLAEATVEWELPIAPERLLPILAGDEQLHRLVVAELERGRVLLTGAPRRRAEAALELLPRPFSRVRTPAPPPPTRVMPVTRWRPFRQLILILLLLTFLGFLFWRQRQSTPADMVPMPAAAYLLAAANEDQAVAGQVYLDAFFMDRFEVTNQDYRRCVERGACAWPVRTASATHNDYFTDPAFDEYPVVNVTQPMAASYCLWQNKRLPTAGEWQAAASVAPTTGQPFRFPWGETFEAQRTNSASTGFGDTVEVGSFRPGGESPSGAADMAGNVAEWTSTLTPEGAGAEVRAVVKGGSYASSAEAVAAAAEMQVVVGSAMPQLGFRCARTISR